MSAIYNEYREHQEDDYAEFLEFKERKLREQGLLPDGDPLGDSVHPDTVKSYAKLKREVPDSPYLASRRHLERLKRMLIEIDGSLDVNTTIPTIYRLKDKESGKEYLVWNEYQEFRDRNGNLKKLDYIHCGQHQEVEGVIHRNARHEITHSEITEHRTIFEKTWSKKNFEELMKRQNVEDGQTEYICGFTKNTGKGAVISRYDKVYSIKNTEDFKNGTFAELQELAQRGLSSSEPSLNKLKQSVAEDPSNSLYKRERGYLSPDKISYTQTSYR